jgi:tetratricopeptide (TPR) repeat protein
MPTNRPARSWRRGSRSPLRMRRWSRCGGEAKAGLGDPDGALADWRRALALAPEDIGTLYSSAFLLDREGRLAEAAEAWRSIIAWNEARGYTLQSDWPKAELSRLQTE